MINLEESLNQINERIIDMIKKTGRSIEVTGLTLGAEEFDKYLYGESKILEEECDEIEIAIKEESTYSIVRYQPAARDLRFLIGVMQLTTDLERISDLCAGTMSLIKYVFEKKFTEDLIAPIKKMINKISYIFQLFEKAFLEKDIKNSYLILGLDDEIDELRDQIYDEIDGKLRANMELLEAGMKIIVIAHKFERVADVIQNLAESSIYILKGDVIKHIER